MGFPNIPTPSALPAKVDLNFSLNSFSSSSRLPTATIPGQDPPVFTTDSQSKWLPSSSPSLPAQPAHHQQHYQQLLPPQQDFVLFDTPKRHPPNRPASQSSATGSASLNSTNQQQSPWHLPQDLQRQRAAQILQAQGHTASSTAFPNRFNNAKNNHFYASSAPSSTAALNQNQSRQRPPVPLFNQQINGNQAPTLKMDVQDFEFEDFTAFEGGAPASALSSPANMAFDLSSSMHSSNIGTVSPQDLLMNEPFMSAPNSTALTALTSPSIYNESPDFNDSCDVSPNFGSSDFDDSGNWFSLFPDQNPVAAAPAAPAVDQSPATKSEDFETVEKPAQRRKSSNSSSPTGRHSSVSGVNSRRRDKPLPPIIVEDPNDTVAMKRARNTLAARKSRERKAIKFEELEEKIRKLEADRDHWKQVAIAHGATQ
ncbi:hypothetical protein KVR01_012662 [Diaporthe batatas]|uniref:amino acid starvation-responsive transcription factor GCN4 n=1 Tax=Diaporthe batatas TaxID=748121 RepID=UPI001D04C37E|nr:amino acid starvation-responsive transcription factor GCN4 [Diaporthe batatas]KAG8157620.1 hypothetical protein KVR01_012662 [Diaporthe batatas]